VRVGNTANVTEPASTPRRLFRRAARGRDETTPLIAISAVTVFVGAIVAVVLVVAFVVYYTS
jgi:hypothetical protein